MTTREILLACLFGASTVLMLGVPFWSLRRDHLIDKAKAEKKLRKKLKAARE